MARIDAPEKVSGSTVYTADVRLPGLCHLAAVRSPFPHARIVRVDASEALALPGVLGVFTAADLGDCGTYGRSVRDIPLLAAGETRFVGERVVAVAAESRVLAERAAARVHVDYEQLPAVFDAVEAVAPGAPLVHAEPWTYPGAAIKAEDGSNLQSVTRHAHGGDVEAALAASAFTVDQTYTAPAMHQGYIEPHCCTVSADESGRMRVWAPNKSPYRLRAQLAACLGVDPATIEVYPTAIGGDFGAKGSPMDAPLCLAVSKRLRRPVQMVMRYAEDLMAANPRHDARMRVRLGCDGQGRLTALDVDTVLNGGAYGGFKPIPIVTLLGAMHGGSSYRIPCSRVVVRIAYTHTVPRGHMRTPGAPQTAFAIESALDELAARAGVDPVAIRRDNLVRSGETNTHGTAWPEARGVETLEAALEAYRPLPAPPGWRHGRGVAMFEHGTYPYRTSVRLRARDDGGLTVFVPFFETGTGAHTVVQRTFAQVLDLPPEKVEVVPVSTAELPDDDGVGASRVTTGIAVAAEQAAAAFRAHGGRGEVTVEVKPQGAPPVTSFCAHIAQVAVDPGTGQMKVLELLTTADVAEVVNPIAHRLQIEGGLAQAYGYACLEDLEISDGRVGAANLGDYKLPSSRDVPPFRVVLLPGGVGVGPTNVKGIGELCNVAPPAAIANALADAVGVRLRDLPLTAERIYAALHPEAAEAASGASQAAGD